ncbi:MAG: DUF2203 domain-containing protein [Gemmatimonadaceae bacterium]
MKSKQPGGAGTPATPSTPTKIFSVEDANRTLPLVSRIVQDIVAQHTRWRERVARFELSSPPESQLIEREVHELAAEIQSYVQELDQLGIEIKDYTTGLIDFPGELAGRRVWLCWRLGEAAVEYWHELDAGYSGRQRLTPRAVA